MISMAEIELSRGLVALVDDADFDWLSRWRWQAHKAVVPPHSYYAQRSEARDDNGRRPYVSMHRAILGNPVGLIVDHKNGNTLDNRRDNLRACSPSQSCCNRRPFAGKAIPYKGVYGVGRRFYALIQFEGVKHSLGGYATPEDAAKVYDQKARELHGEYARVNFPDEAA